MIKDKSEKIRFVCFLIASICFYMSSILKIMNKEDNWVIGLCLGSAFLCLSTTHLNKNKDKNANKDKDKER